MFTEKDGHLPDTPENRDLLVKVASDGKNYLGKDKYGNDLYGKINPDGSQTWAQVRDGVIQNGGKNAPGKIRTLDTKTGQF
ncbi:hypothetical protein NIES2130_39550 [Scytonema sp. HK-05]|nr:hypothetical protein NIES2130_39550 [Scytonema sp. HK-05]